jgi:hypothetical protein
MKILTGMLLMAIAIPSYAMFCPSNYNQINIGDSIASVEQACGKPATQSVAESSEDQPQEWTYYVKSQPSDTATLRMTVAFTSGVVTNMSVNGIGISSTQICGATTQVGDREATVKTVCGTPAFINQSNLPSATKDKVKVTTFNYNSTPPVTLIFNDGSLKSRQ